jgi:hypothetical protein
MHRGGPVVPLFAGVVALILVPAGGIGLPSAPPTQTGFVPDTRTLAACAAEDLDCLAQASLQP